MASVLLNLREEDIKRIKHKIEAIPCRTRPETSCSEVIRGSRTGHSVVHASKKGYPSITVTRKKKYLEDERLSACLPLHAVVYYVHHKEVALKDNKEDISHLCGRPSCVYINHLIKEVFENNQTLDLISKEVGLG